MLAAQQPAPDILAAAAMRASGAGKAIGSAILEAVSRLGRDGVIVAGDPTGGQVRAEFAPGMRWNNAYLSSFFVTDPATGEAWLREPYVLACDGKLSSPDDLVALMRKIGAGNALLIVAVELDEEVLGAAVLHKLAGTLKVCACKAPSFGDRRGAWLADIAIVTGGKVIAPERIASTDPSQLGRAKLARAGRISTVIAGGRGDAAAIARRVAEIEKSARETKSDYDREKFEERRVAVSKGVAMIHLDGSPGGEMRLRDALTAWGAAVDEGVVPGDGAVYLSAASALGELQSSGDEQLGIAIVRKALEEPGARIAENRKIGAGGGASAGASWDLTKSARSALQTAAINAWLLMTNRQVLDLRLARRKAGNGA